MVDEQFQEMVAAWREAASDLEIRIVIPWLFSDESGTTHECLAFLPDFGGPKGMAIANLGDTIMDNVWEALEESPYYHSSLNPSSYGVYERSRWISTLYDWGWFGPATERPGWYTGSPHSD